MDDDEVVFVFNESPRKGPTLGEISDAVAKMALEKVNAAQHRMHLTAIAVGGLCGLAGFIIGWLVFAC